MPSKPFAHAVAALASVLVAVTFAVLVGGDTRTWSVLLVDVALAGVAAGTAYAAIRAAARSVARRNRLAWRLVSGAAGAWSASQVVWTVRELLGQNPAVADPSVADLGFVAAVPLITGALLAFPTNRFAWTRSRRLCDGLIVAASLLLFGWVTTLQHRRPDELADAAVYPLAAAGAGAVAFMALARASGAWRQHLGLVGSGLLTLGVTSGVYGHLAADGTYRTAASLLDVGYPLGFGLIGLAAIGWRRDPSSTQSAPSVSETFAPFSAVIVSGAIVVALLAADVVQVDSYMSAAAALLVVLIGARQVVTARENAALRHRVENSAAWFAAIVEQGTDLVAVFSTDGRVKYTAPALQASGIALCADGGRTSVNVHPDDVTPLHVAIRGAVAAAEHTVTHVRFRARDAARRWRHVDGTLTTLVRDEAINGIVFNGRDVTVQVDAETALRRQATHDALTGLPNRSAFRERLADALSTPSGREGGVAVMFCDLDRFKVINDSLGHAAGDIVLTTVAHRLRDAVGEGGLVARFSGDEFVVLCPDTGGEAGAAAIAQRAIDAMGAPISIDGEELYVTTSIGIRVAGPNDTADGLVQDADVAMYRAKKGGRDRAEMFDGSFRERTQTRLDLETALRRAVAAEEFTLAYQPIYRVRPDDALSPEPVLASFEALLRWDRPGHGPMRPDQFVPALEDTGLIVAVGEWVLRTACAQLARWRAAGLDVSVAVNLSIRQMQDPDLTSKVAAAVRDSGIDAGHVCLEVTESTFWDDEDAVAAVLAALRETGVRFAIDDFGTGYSSLARLWQFPVGSLKVDRSFVGAMGERGGDELVTGIIRLAHSLGLDVVAEGVETSHQLAKLQLLGCDNVQGYLLGRPVAVGDIDAQFGLLPGVER